MNNVVFVAGARPNFVKLAPVIRALHGRVHRRMLHTGQHYDEAMSGSFLNELELPAPDENLGVGSGSHATQTAAAMVGTERFLLRESPDLVVVVGDVNSTLAAALVAAKLIVPVAHVEAGLRSFDRTMPEEVNRVLTDAVADLCLTTSPEAADNLTAEGIARDRIRFVGNPMIDTLLRHLPRVRALQQTAGLPRRSYGVLTLHRPSNVDDAVRLVEVAKAVSEIAEELPLVFPAHPRTEKMLLHHGVTLGPGVRITPPVGYLEFLSLMEGARLVVTDSGGIQEETTVLGVPCLTLRDNTERPVTVACGTNRLAGTRYDRIRSAAAAALQESSFAPRQLPGWDGRAGERIAAEIVAFLGAQNQSRA